ncbi:MAG: hypothetical protein KatS3mg082_1387 [Nitrospiraceae bacterium]|nr:MAG: hypothetical protein KatS3mg082_1387 [Nitrospiraceae bacterium]
MVKKPSGHPIPRLQEIRRRLLLGSAGSPIPIPGVRGVSNAIDRILDRHKPPKRPFVIG